MTYCSIVVAIKKEEPEVINMAATTVTPFCEDDWQNERSVLDANRYMLENQVDCDVIFTLLPSGSGVVDADTSATIGSHRYVLISRSPVFFAMFTGPLAEQQSQQSLPVTSSKSILKDIRITDIAPSTFWQLLRYMYYEELQLTDDTAFAVLYAAKKYMLTSLTKRCISYLESVLSPDNVCAYLENAFLFEDEYPALRQRCLQVIEHQSKRVFHSEPFFEISKDTLCRVLRSERLSVHEVDVFRACLHWAERRVGLLNLAPTSVNKRQMLGEALRLIHLPAISVEEFTKIVVPSGLLSVNEENAVFRSLLGASVATGSEFTTRQASLPFPLSSRNFVATRCDVMYKSFTRNSSANSFTPGLPRGTASFRTGWSLTFYCDNSVKIQELGFLGAMKANVYIAQNGYRKLELTSASSVNNFQFGDDLELEAGLFTVGADAPFTYVGDYFTRDGNCSSSASVSGATSPGSLPTVLADHDGTSLLIRDATAVGFLSYLVLVPTDEIYFIDNYYSDDVDVVEFQPTVDVVDQPAGDCAA